MLMITILVPVTKAMLFKCIRLTTEMVKRNCGFVATKMENIYGNQWMVGFDFNLLESCV